MPFWQADPAGQSMLVVHPHEALARHTGAARSLVQFTHTRPSRPHALLEVPETHVVPSQHPVLQAPAHDAAHVAAWGSQGDASRARTALSNAESLVVVESSLRPCSLASDSRPPSAVASKDASSGPPVDPIVPLRAAPLHATIAQRANRRMSLSR
jgi:hypothetical protein